MEVSSSINIKKIILITTAILFAGYFANVKAVGLASMQAYAPAPQDSALVKEIRVLLVNKQLSLQYPKSVNSFYSKKEFTPVWISNKGVSKTREAMLLIDCVLQFGLSHSDYHPDELLYDKLYTIQQTPAQLSTLEIARFEVLLTDAMLTFINHLHYGKLNPVYTVAKTDGQETAFKAEDVLIKALAKKNISATILGAQPQMPQYITMQNHMRMLTGQYVDDCYEIPQDDIKLLAINMERLRWANSDDETYIHINIPSFTLKFYQPDTAYSFKVIVGKPTNATPVLQSNITHFTTAPDWKVPAGIFKKELLPKALKDDNYMERNQFAIYNTKGQFIEPLVANLKHISQNPAGYYARQSSGCDNALGLLVFRFNNPYSVYVHDTPAQKLFARNERALSHGCIRVQQADKLARLLLQHDGQANKLPTLKQALSTYQTKTFGLKKAVPIKITYLTCEVINGELIIYKDIYNKNESLEKAMYKSTDTLSMQ